LFHEDAQNLSLIILPQWVTGFLAAEARPTSGDLVLEAVIGDGWGMVGQIHVRERRDKPDRSPSHVPARRSFTDRGVLLRQLGDTRDDPSTYEARMGERPVCHPA
jgi:hypothetical protein